MDRTITALQEHVGSYIWQEVAIVSVLSCFIDTFDDATAVALAGSHAQTHARLAELWHQRMPTLWDRKDSHLIAPPNSDVEKSFAALTAPSQSVSQIQLLTDLYNVHITSLLAQYTQHQQVVDSRTDPATHDVLAECITYLTQHIDHAQLIISLMKKRS